MIGPLYADDLHNHMNNPLHEISVFPNPVKDEITIDLNGLPQEYRQLDVTVNDLNGKILKKFSINTELELSNGMYIFDSQEFGSGMYVISIIVDDKLNKSFKIIKQ